MLLGNGDGTFQQPVEYDTGEGTWHVAAADLNKDGYLDIVSANKWAGTVSVLLGNGDGSFQDRSNIPMSPPPVSIAVGDVTGDGNLDLVHLELLGRFVYPQPRIYVMAGNGNGQFDAPSSLSVSNLVRSLALADLDGTAFSTSLR